MKIRVFISLCLFSVHLVAQQINVIDSILNSHPAFSKIVSNPSKYKVQIIYTQIDRDKNNKPSFKQYSYRLDPKNYFYCASLVKLPCSVLALEKLNELKVEGLTKDTRMFTDSSSSCQRRTKYDTSAVSGFPSVAQYIRKMLLVSDNLAYGRIYEFLGVDHLHGRLNTLGFPDMRIVHRFDGGCKGTENTRTNPVSFFDQNEKLIYHQEEQMARTEYANPLGTVKVGKAYVGAGGKKVKEPKDFTTMNYIPLQDINDILKRVVFNDYLKKKEQFNITKEYQAFLLKYLSMLPRESASPRYDKSYYDSYKKYFMYGDSKKTITNEDLRIFNIVGQSYGFMVDCAYIVDFKTKTEFMLSAVIYANEDEILNDGKYEYNNVALPYLAQLGRSFYQYELRRKKDHLPDLSDLKFDYSK